MAERDAVAPPGTPDFGDSFEDAVGNSSTPGVGGVTPFEEAVDRVLRSLGEGDLVTYGEVADEAGFPRRARAVGALLAGSDGRYPWWRVVTSTGRLVPGLEREHAKRLVAEGHQVTNGRVRRSPAR